MKERPILFSAPMVRALLAGTKTQTRRVVKPQPIDEISTVAGTSKTRFFDTKYYERADYKHRKGIGTQGFSCPYGQLGDRLWVRESIFFSTEKDAHFYSATGIILPGVDYDREPPPSIGLKTKSIRSIHMPRWASRILLEIVSVRVERLCEISPNDCIAEGAWPVEQRELGRGHEAIAAYRALWESINGPGSWDANPWVWVVEFKKVNP